MRGKEELARAVNRVTGITPAYAGKSQGIYDVQACGGGSPPRMRGKAIVFVDDYLAVRITPAYAGKSANISVLSIR